MKHIRRSIPKELHAALDLAEAQGWTVTKEGRQQHVHWTAPNGGTVISTGTRSGGRAYQNVWAQLRRHGLKME